MNTEKYQKPTLKYVSLQNEEAIANTCWGYHGTETVLYCDIPGEGYCSFQIASGKGGCSLDLINVMYHYGDNQQQSASQEQITVLDNILRQSAGESGNSYHGEGTTVIPDHPGNWS